MTNESNLMVSLDMGIPRVEQFIGVWAMEPRAFSDFAATVRKMDLAAHMAAAIGTKREIEVGYEIQDGIAVISVSGVMTKYGSSLTGGGTLETRRAIRNAARDESAHGIMLLIDSPGGTVSGTDDLADEVRSARESKPVRAYIEDMGASAAYWLASQAETIHSNPTAMIGSIGVYGVVTDSSGEEAQAGRRVILISTGKYKGAGYPGTPITEDIIEDERRVVETLNEAFLEAVSRGRGMTRANLNAIADGRVWVGAQAADLGLTDGVRSFAKSLNEFREALNAAGESHIERRQEAMSEELKDAPTAATIHEIKAACPGADPAFLCEQIEAGATVDQAKDAFIAAQNARLEAAEQKAREAAEAEKAKESAGGVEPVSMEAGESKPQASAREAWNALVSEKVKGGLPRAKAITTAARENAELHQQMLDEVNAAH